MTFPHNKQKNFSETILASALAENSRIAYAKGWHCFELYCKRHCINPLEATSSVLVDFFIYLATEPRLRTGKLLSMSTVILYKSAINRKYTEYGLASPIRHPKVEAIIKGLTRFRGMSPRQVKALSANHLGEMLSVCDDMTNKPSQRLIGLRDSAILAVGFAGALRRSELCALSVNDIEILPRSDKTRSQKMFLHIRKSKTDQAGRGQRIAVLDGKKIRPVERVQNWLRESRITEGPLFQTMRRGGMIRGLPLHHSDIPRLVKHYAKSIGLDPSKVSGHSLRAGFVTSAAIHHARLDKIMEVTRHVNPATVMKYIRDADSFRDHAGEGFL